MAAITVTSTRVSHVFSDYSRRRTHLAVASGVTAGQWLYTASNGRVGPGNTATSGKKQFRGMALNSAGDNQSVDVLEEGYFEGADLSALAYDAIVYGNDTDGVIGTAAGTTPVPIGRVVPVSDRDPVTGLPSKLLYVRAEMLKDWS